MLILVCFAGCSSPCSRTSSSSDRGAGDGMEAKGGALRVRASDLASLSPRGLEYWLSSHYVGFRAASAVHSIDRALRFQRRVELHL